MQHLPNDRRMRLFNYPCGRFDGTSTQQDRDTTGLARFLESLWDDSTRRSQLMARTVTLRLSDITEAAFPTLMSFLRSHRCSFRRAAGSDTLHTIKTNQD